MSGSEELLHASAIHGHSELPSERREVLASLALGSSLHKNVSVYLSLDPAVLQTFSPFHQAIS